METLPSPLKSTTRSEDGDYTFVASCYYYRLKKCSITLHDYIVISLVRADTNIICQHISYDKKSITGEESIKLKAIL